MEPVFNERKATQVAASFIKLSGGKLNYMKLVKLMYLAERQALLKWGRPITYDLYFSLPHGPILSATLDLINESRQINSAHIWSAYISAPDKYEVTLQKDCPSDELSEVEENIIKEIFRQYGHFNEWELVDHLHSVLPEWKDPNSSSIPISYRDILMTSGESEEEINAIEEEIRNVCFVANLLGS